MRFRHWVIAAQLAVMAAVFTVVAAGVYPLWHTPLHFSRDFSRVAVASTPAGTGELRMRAG